jgi:enterochelin esterase-like enzyme
MEPDVRFAALLRDRHFSYEFQGIPGGHDWREWNAQIPACFDRLFEHLGQAG